MTASRIVLILLTLACMHIPSNPLPIQMCLFQNVLPPSQQILQVHLYEYNGVLSTYILTSEGSSLTIFRKYNFNCSLTDVIGFSVTVDNFNVNFQIFDDDLIELTYMTSGSIWKVKYNSTIFTTVDFSSVGNLFKGAYLRAYDFYFYYNQVGFEGINWNVKVSQNSIYDQFYESFVYQNVVFKLNRQQDVLVIQQKLTTKIRFKYFDSAAQIIADRTNDYFVNAASPITCFCLDSNYMGYFLMSNGVVASYDLITRTLVNGSFASGLDDIDDLVCDVVNNNIFTIDIDLQNDTTIGQIVTTGTYNQSLKTYTGMKQANTHSSGQYFALWDNSTNSFCIMSKNTTPCLDGQIYNSFSLECQNFTASNDSSASQSFEEDLSMVFQNSFLKILNKIPGGRKVVKFLFIFFSNFDDLWLYQYHERDYGETMNLFFEYINNLQKDKWQMVQANTMRSWLEQVNVKEKSVIEYVDNRTIYSSEKFIEFEGRGEGFLPNAWFYLSVYAILTLAVFFILRRLFFLFFNWRISVIFRPFSFWSYLILMLLDGNVQYFYFLFLNQAKLGFSFTFHEKMVNMVTYFLFYVFILVTIGSYFLFYTLHKKLAKYFFDKSKCNIKGAIFLCISNTLRNFILGAIHNFLRSEMELQLISLGVVEVSFILIVIVFMSVTRSFTDYFGTWINIVFSFLRIAIIGALYLQQTSVTDQILLENIEISLQFFIRLYLLLFLGGVVVELLRRSIEVITLKKIDSNQDQETKQPKNSRKNGKQEHSKREGQKKKEQQENSIKVRRIQIQEILESKKGNTKVNCKIKNTQKKKWMIAMIKEEQIEEDLQQ